MTTPDRSSSERSSSSFIAGPDHMNMDPQARQAFEDRLATFIIPTDLFASTPTLVMAPSDRGVLLSRMAAAEGTVVREPDAAPKDDLQDDDLQDSNYSDDYSYDERAMKLRVEVRLSKLKELAGMSKRSPKRHDLMFDLSFFATSEHLFEALAYSDEYLEIMTTMATSETEVPYFRALASNSLRVFWWRFGHISDSERFRGIAKKQCDKATKRERLVPVSWVDKIKKVGYLLDAVKLDTTIELDLKVGPNEQHVKQAILQKEARALQMTKRGLAQDIVMGKQQSTINLLELLCIRSFTDSGDVWLVMKKNILSKGQLDLEGLFAGLPSTFPAYYAVRVNLRRFHEYKAGVRCKLGGILEIVHSLCFRSDNGKHTENVVSVIGLACYQPDPPHRPSKVLFVDPRDAANEDIIRTIKTMGILRCGVACNLMIEMADLLEACLSKKANTLSRIVKDNMPHVRDLQKNIQCFCGRVGPELKLCVCSSCKKTGRKLYYCNKRCYRKDNVRHGENWCGGSSSGGSGGS